MLSAKHFQNIIVLFGLLAMNMHGYTSAFAARQTPSQQHENPSHQDSLQELMRLRNEGVAHYESGIGQKKSFKLFEAALKLKPKSAVENYNFGVINRKQNNPATAIVYFKKAVELEPDFAHPYYSLGLIYREQGSIDEAFSAFEKARNIMPEESSIHYQLSRLYREKGDNEKALQAIVNTLQLDPYHTGALYQLYLFHQQNGDDEKAKELFSEFSRIKKALGKTRKEINPDESQLAMPVGSQQENLISHTTGLDSKPVFALRHIARKYQPVSYDVIDFDEDGFEDLVLGDKSGRILVLRNKNGQQFKLIKKMTIDKGNAIKSLRAARLAQKGNVQFMAATKSGLYVTQDKSHESSNTENKNINSKKIVKKILSTNIEKLDLFDIDHDGDLDIVANRFQKVLINKGDGRFEDKHPLFEGKEAKIVDRYKGDIIGSDFRNIIAVDFVLSNDKGDRRLLRDEMSGRYILSDPQTLDSHPGLKWMDKADMDNDGWTEVVNITGDELIIDFNQGRHQFASERLGKMPVKADGIKGIIGDFNNDGFKDIFVGTSTGPNKMWINKGQREFELVDIDGVDNKASPGRQLMAVDIDRDGKLDILGISDSHGLYALLNKTDTEGMQWVKLQLKGIRSAPNGQYTQVEVRYGSFYSKYESEGGVLHIPLGRAKHAEILRITWPNGFVESKFKVDSSKLWAFEESERISGSCPSIYAWNGERFSYITDAFISGPMGVPVAQGRYFPVDHDEYVKIPGEYVKRDGDIYKISIVEELKEATYLDRIRLYAVDHPEDIEVYPNEYLNPPDFPEFYIHASAGARPLVYATDQDGNDVTALVSEMDYKYPHRFTRLQYTGFTSPHGVEIGLPRDAIHSPHLRLFFTGWFYYFDSTSLMSASQHQDMNMIMPQLQGYRNGRWEVIKTIGIPSGKDKTIVVDLGTDIPEDVEKLRVWTNVEIYWDRILFDATPYPRNAYRMAELPVSQAKLRFHGFSKLLRPVSDFPQPDRFDYHTVRYQSLWNPLAGQYTRYGEVGRLLHAQDSYMAVLGSGDELAMHFDGRELPLLEPGWRRDFLLYLNGYVKDGDKYTVHAGQIDPMPFAGMQSYPYSEQDREHNPFWEPAYQRYLQEYQTRKPLQFTRPGG